jgi:hypothetical protein
LSLMRAITAMKSRKLSKMAVCGMHRKYGRDFQNVLGNPELKRQLWTPTRWLQKPECSRWKPIGQ